MDLQWSTAETLLLMHIESNPLYIYAAKRGDRYDDGEEWGDANGYWRNFGQFSGNFRILVTNRKDVLLGGRVKRGYDKNSTPMRLALPL